MSEDKTFGVVARPKAPEGYVGRWLNVYDYGVGQAGGMYLSRGTADRIAKPYRLDCVYVYFKAPTGKRNRRWF